MELRETKIGVKLGEKEILFLFLLGVERDSFYLWLGVGVSV